MQLLNIFSNSSKEGVDSTYPWKDRVLSSVKKYKIDLLAGIFLSSACTYKLGQAKQILAMTANIVSRRSHITNLALFALFTTSGISLASSFYQKKQLTNTKKVLENTKKKKAVTQRQLANCKAELSISQATQESIQIDRDRIISQLRDHGGKLREARLLISNLQQELKNTQKDKVLARITNFCGISDLHLAALQGWLELVKNLVNKGSDINKQDLSGRTPLMHACLGDHLSIVNYLFQLPEINLEKEDFYGGKLIHYAALVGSSDLVVHLLDKGVNVNERNNEGVTPLMAACQRRNLSFIKMFSQLPEVNLTLEDYEGSTLMHHAVLGENIEVIKYLQEKELGINKIDFEGHTPLTEAVIHGKEEVVKYFISQNINITQSDFQELVNKLKSSEEECYINIFLIFLQRLKEGKKKEFIAFFEREENKIDKIAKYLPSARADQIHYDSVTQAVKESMSSDGETLDPLCDVMPIINGYLGLEDLI